MRGRSPLGRAGRIAGLGELAHDIDGFVHDPVIYAGDQLTEDETTNVTEKLEGLKKALGEDDVEAIGSATE
ncbi:MAG: hypothetical protein QF593_00010, partial [Nitrospinota bacterium]|nr:hypothetical protein [Nitrospinota bacterium]